MRFSESVFAARFGITRRDLEACTWPRRCRTGGDYADLYFEYLLTSSIGIDESIVKSAAQGVSHGRGRTRHRGRAHRVRLQRRPFAGEDPQGRAGGGAASPPGPARSTSSISTKASRHNLYPVLTAPTETAFAERVELVKRADRAARAYDPRVFQVQAIYADNLRHVLVATSDGVLTVDRQPLARLSVHALARRDGETPQQGHAGGGGRVELDFFLKDKPPEHFARRGRARSHRHAGRRRSAGRRDDRGAGAGLAGHPAA